MTSAKCIKRPKVSLIVAALLPELGIGYKGKLPWSLKQEMKYFRKLTTETIDPTKRNAVVMGRKTYFSIPIKFRPLKGRLNIVLSRNIENLKEQLKQELLKNEDLLKVSSSLPHTLEMLSEMDQIEEIFIIGGAEVYNQLMKENYDHIDAVYLTEISHQNTEDKIEMDAFFNLDHDLWRKTEGSKLKELLESKGLHEEFTLNGNVEKDFVFDFTLWEKKTG